MYVLVNCVTICFTYIVRYLLRKLMDIVLTTSICFTFSESQSTVAKYYKIVLKIFLRCTFI